MTWNQYKEIKQQMQHPIAINVLDASFPEHSRRMILKVEGKKVRRSRNGGNHD